MPTAASATRSGPLVDASRLRPRLASDVTVLPTADGGARLSRPLVRRWTAHRWLARLLRAPTTLAVDLDDIGRFVVERLDGRSLGSLADDLAAHLRLSRREAEVALGDFLRLLTRRRVLAWSEPAARGPA
jgi:hypothetical protein